ncbi:hypothetical protein AB0K00_14330 [Dactylosporangium sp. NPDC049525]|uniref:hypothetical protein n=1 Tax=Dactylosporangium sp. NPDC049525 TaxID=3154730 RepID=UPI00343A5673
MTEDVVRPPRPAQVNVAFWLQLAAVTLLLGVVGATIAQAVHYNAEVSRVAALVGGVDPGEVRDERASNIMLALFVGVPTVVLCLWLAVTAWPVRRGSNIARIFVFVAGGGQVLLAVAQVCGGFLLAPLAFTAMDSGDDVIVDDGVSWEGDSEFIDTLYSRTETVSGIYFVGVLLAALSVLAITLTVVLLLALPPAHRYFSPKPPQAWPPHPALGPMPYYICPDPSAHLPAAATITAEPSTLAPLSAPTPAPAPAPDQPQD